MKERGNRDELVVATKYTGLLPVPHQKIRVNCGGNHIKSLSMSLEASLKKLQTSYVDIVSICFLCFVMISIPSLVFSG